MQVFIFLFLIVLIIYISTSFVISFLLLHLDRQPIPKNPKDYGMDFENFTVQTEDKINLKGWFISGNSDKIIIIAHVAGLTKYGSSKNFQSIAKLYNGEIEHLKIAQHLHNEGYSVIMFDFRNHGESGIGPKGGITSIGLEEYKDILAILNFISTNNNLKNKNIGILGLSLGAISTIIAMSKSPSSFQNVKCQIAVHPITYEGFIRTYLSNLLTPIVSKILMPMVKLTFRLQSPYGIDKMSPKEYIKDIKIPTLYAQARFDKLSDIDSIKKFYEDTKAEKEFYWINNKIHNFEAYSYFEDHPEKMLEWFGKYM